MQAELQQAEAEAKLSGRLSLTTPWQDGTGQAAEGAQTHATQAAVHTRSSASFGQQQERLQELLQAQQYAPLWAYCARAACTHRWIVPFIS